MIKLKSLRTQKGLSQEKVANYLGITQQAYANYERGVRQADYDMLKKLRDFFDVSIDYILGLTDTSLNNHETFTLSPSDREILSLYNQLNDFEKSEVKGFIKGLSTGRPGTHSIAEQFQKSSTQEAQVAAYGQSSQVINKNEN